MNEFDELFNQYFGDNKGDSGMDKMMKLIGKLNNGGGFGGMSPSESTLGEPDTIREFEKDGVTFIESTWETPQGTIVRIETKENVEFTSDYFKKTGIPLGKKLSKEREMTLEEKLEIAKKVEDYETCAELRDEIEARDERKKMSQKNKINDILAAAKKRQEEIKKEWDIFS